MTLRSVLEDDDLSRWLFADAARQNGDDVLSLG